MTNRQTRANMNESNAVMCGKQNEKLTAFNVKAARLPVERIVAQIHQARQSRRQPVQYMPHRPIIYLLRPICATKYKIKYTPASDTSWTARSQSDTYNCSRPRLRIYI